MEEKLSNDSATSNLLNTIREKLTVLSLAGFVWKEIAALTDIPKKVIKELAKGERIILGGNITLKEADYKWLATQIDEAIKRLRNCNEGLGIEKIPEVADTTEKSNGYTLEIQRLSLFLKKEIDDVLIRIEGVKFHETPFPLSNGK